MGCTIRGVIKNLGSRNGLLLPLFFWFAVGEVAFSAPWEVGIIFLGAGEPEEYQQDIDQNIMELARLVPNEKFRLRILREMEDRVVIYEPIPSSPSVSPWDPLFFRSPLPGILVSGELQVFQKTKTDPKNILHDSEVVQEFFRPLYVSPESKRVLILFGHGLGFEGLKAIKLIPLKKLLDETLPSRPGKPLDVLWLDACFMATVEVAYELRSLASLLIASEEAEFSAGAPFQSLRNLEAAPDSVSDSAVEWGKKWLESYSYLEQGSQRRAVYKSAATVSVIDLDRISAFVDQVAQVKTLFGGGLSTELRRSLRKSTEKRKTEMEDLVDVGSFFQVLAKSKLTPNAAQPVVNTLLSQIEFLTSDRRNTSPQVTIPIPSNLVYLVFGFEDWSRGHEEDPETLDRLPPQLQPDGFFMGPEGKRWPYVRVSKKSIPASVRLTPFSVGPRRFNYFLVDPQSQQLLSGFSVFERTQDLYFSEATRPDNPLLFTGYTQSIGRAAELYSGLGILDPSLQAASLDYLRLEFAEKTRWGGL